MNGGLGRLVVLESFLFQQFFVPNIAVRTFLAKHCLASTYPRDLNGVALQGTPLCDIPSGCCFFTGPWTVTRSSLRMLRRVAVYQSLGSPPPPPDLIHKSGEKHVNTA